MRFLIVLSVAVLSGPFAHGQPSSKELVAKFRTNIGADVAAGSIPYLIQYRGERYMYSLREGKLLGESFPFDAKLYGYTDQHNKHRKETELKIGIVPLKVVEVIDGDKGWYQMNEGDAVAMSQAEVDGREQRELHVEVFLGRESFDPKDWQFTKPKSVPVRGQDAWMFQAKTKGTEPLTLYFAKDSGLLLRLTSKAKDLLWSIGDKPKFESFVRDVYLRDWKEFAKRKLPGVLEVYHDGVLWQRMEPVRVSLMKGHDPKLFATPQPQNDK